MTKCYLDVSKTLWEEEKSLFTSNFSFSHNVFKRLVLQTRKNQDLFGKGLNAVMDNADHIRMCRTCNPESTPSDTVILRH